MSVEESSDSGSGSSWSKKMKESSVDRISELPDLILNHILSFLPALDSWRTCMLSSRWQNIWTNSTTLSFHDALSPFNCRTWNDDPTPGNIRFSNFVNKLLLLRNPQCHLENFSLRCRRNHEIYGVCNWIRNVLMYGIKSIDIVINFGDVVRLPSSFFRCSTLETLHLEGSLLINVPTNASLPKLKSMKLVQLMYEVESISSSRFMSSCPLLEYLIVESNRQDANFGMCSIFPSELRDIRVDTRVSLPNRIDLEIPCSNLQCLQLSIKSQEKLKIPSNIFNNKSLEVLELQGSILVCAATAICLPNLTTLKLVNVDYEDDEDVSRLISSCTSLEWLAYYRNSIEIMEFNISSSSCMLKFLEVEFPCGTKAGSEVVINAPALEWLLLSISDQVDYRIENVPSLDEADIQLYQSLDVTFDHFLDVLSNIFHALRNVRILTVNQVSSKVTIPKHVFPKFQRLEVLDVKFDCCRWPALQDLIQNSTNLEDLTVTVDSQCNHDSHEICWKNPKDVPDCLLSSLKRVSLHGFKYLRDEVSMVKYILKNGRILRTMEIQVSSSLCYKRARIARKRLINFHPGSENCKISISEM